MASRRFAPVSVGRAQPGFCPQYRYFQSGGHLCLSQAPSESRGESRLPLVGPGYAPSVDAPLEDRTAQLRLRIPARSCFGRRRLDLWLLIRSYSCPYDYNRGMGYLARAYTRKAVAVDPAIKASNLKRLRRIEGQIRGLQRMIEEDRYCPEILVQISSVQQALRGVGRALMRNHLQHCVTEALTKGDRKQAEQTYDELLELIYRYLR